MTSLWNRACIWPSTGPGCRCGRRPWKAIAGKQEDGSAKTREAKVAVVYTAEERDPETGAALKDRGSETSSCLIDSAAAAPGSREPSAFAMRLDREARRRGLHDAGELVVISDGADWIRHVAAVFMLRWLRKGPGLTAVSRESSQHDVSHATRIRWTHRLRRGVPPISGFRPSALPTGQPGRPVVVAHMQGFPQRHAG